MSERDWDQLLAVSHGNIARLFAERQQRDVEEIYQEAARVAFGHAARVDAPCNFIAAFRAELERKPLEPRSLVHDLVNQARAHLARGHEPLDFAPMLLR